MKSHVMMMVIVFCLHGHTLAQEKSRIILSSAPSLDIRDHKQYDVVVFTSWYPGPKISSDELKLVYEVAFFREERDTLRCFRAGYGIDQHFDEAYYTWENDSTVVIRLHNTGTGKNQAFKAIGYENISGIDDI